MYPVLLMWLVACGGAPKVTGVEPPSVTPGDGLAFAGEGFSDPPRIEIVDGGGAAFLLESVAVDGSARVTGTVPDATPPGIYAIRLDGKVAEGVAVHVERERDERACTGAWSSNTQLSLPRGIVAIERFYTGGRRETIEIPIDAIAVVELIRTTTPAGEPCTAIRLRRTNGRTVLFQEDTRYDLAERAQRTATTLQRPLEEIVIPG